MVSPGTAVALSSAAPYAPSLSLRPKGSRRSIAVERRFAYRLVHTKQNADADALRHDLCTGRKSAQQDSVEPRFARRQSLDLADTVVVEGVPNAMHTI